jgi:Asp-tRNA(Asn)/Glu-tRNA(Gln) amidotransferase A subunit family amidase
MLSLLDLLRRIDAGELSPEASLQLSREEAVAGDGDVEAFVALDTSARVGRAGPLRGIAVGVKDIIDTSELPTEYGSPIYAGWRPKADAAVVSAAKRAGATVLGKTTTTPFAFLDPARTRNPRNLRHTPGGSSSGSAAAVAAGFVPLSLGTQTGGSVIRPASYCGVVGIKPSFRLLPTVGVKTFSWTLDTVGLFAASVPDGAFALAALAGRPALRLDGASAAAPRFGVVAQDFAGDPEPASAAALERAARLVERAGAAVRPLALPAVLADAFRSHGTVQDFEGRQALAWERDHHAEALPPRLAALLTAAEPIPPQLYDDARRTAHRARAALKAVFGEVDALLTFSAPGAAPETLQSTGDSRFNRLWTLMGCPCVTVPGPADPAGLPVGIQVIAPFGRDDAALGAAWFAETALRDHG